MQDRYAGDVGDFMKFGLLRCLVDGEVPLRLGANWYLTGDEFHNSDGKHIGYLDPSNSQHATLRACDPDLMDRLDGVVRTGRSVSALEGSGALPADSLTFSDRLDDKMGLGGRRAWHERALIELSRAEVIFVDPDNGMRLARSGTKPSKFAFADELSDYVARGQSLVVYHHADRSAGGVAAQVPRRLEQLREVTGTAPLAAVVARRGSTRFFFVVAVPDHRKQLEYALSTYEPRWARHAEVVRYTLDERAKLDSVGGHW